MEEATDLTSAEKSSDIMSQGMGPKPMLNADTKTDKEITGMMLSLAASSVLPSLSAMKKYIPETDQHGESDYNSVFST